MNLADLQRAFQQNVLHDDARVAGSISASEAIPAAARLAIYADGYRYRLIDALASNYPRLQQLLGGDRFAELGREYLEAHPSGATSVRWFGDRLAGFLAGHPEYKGQPWLAELAQWEWAIAAAFDAPDQPSIDGSQLGTVEATQWPALQFAFHSSVQVLQLDTAAPALFKALSEDAPPPTPQRNAEMQAWLIWRPELTPRYRSLTADESAALQCALNGGTFAAVCDALAEWYDEAGVPLAAARHLRSWLADAMIIGAQVHP